MSRYFEGWAPYVPVAARRRKAEREMEKLRKKGAVRLAGEDRGTRRSPERSGARRGATTWRAIAITRTGCRAGAPTCATARWSICRSRRAR